jgi:hypothetical protein
MRCNDCNKFVGQEPEEPEAELEVARADGTDTCKEITVAGQVTVSVNCAECGTQLKQASFDVEESITLTDDKHCGEEHDLEVEVDSCEATEEYKGRKGAPARYQKHYYGFQLSYSVSCSCGEPVDLGGSFEDSMQASSMDEMQ